jgi:hypothetical protein
VKIEQVGVFGERLDRVEAEPLDPLHPQLGVESDQLLERIVRCSMVGASLLEVANEPLEVGALPDRVRDAPHGHLEKPAAEDLVVSTAPLCDQCRSPATWTALCLDRFVQVAFLVGAVGTMSGDASESMFQERGHGV